MSILRTIAMFIYLFGYMILHYSILRRAERAQGDRQTGRRLRSVQHERHVRLPAQPRYVVHRQDEAEDI